MTIECCECKHWLPKMTVLWIFKAKSPHPRCAKIRDTQGEPSFASIERMHLAGECGPEARYFEAKS